MGGDTIRELGALGLIAGAVTVGAVVQFIYPRMGELQTTQAQIRQITADDGANGAASPDVQARADHIRDRVRLVSEMNAKAGDSRLLYQLLLEFGEAHGIEFESIQPQAQGKVDPKATHVRTTAFRLAWVADLSSTGHLLEDLDRCEIPHRVSALHMLPVQQDGEMAVSVSAQIEFLQYPIAPELASMAGLNDPTGTDSVEENAATGGGGQ